MRRLHRALPLVLALLLVGSVGLVAAGPAQASSYQVAVCSDLGTGKTAPSDDWTPTTNGAAYEGASGCSSGGVMTAWLSGQHNFADSAAMTFSAPANTTINAFWLWRYMYSGVSQPYGSPVTGIYYDQTPIDVNSQFYGSPEPEGSATQQTIVGAQGLDAHSITIDALCGGGPGGVCLGGNPTAQVNVYGGDIELNDPVAPTVANVSGTLTHGGTLSGQQTIVFSASDQGSGVYSASLLIDGIPVIGGIVNSNGGRCVPIRTASDGALVFAYAAPCPTSTSGALTVNTSHISGGTHQAELLVTDAAGNTTVGWSATISLDNAPTNIQAPTIQDSTRPGASPRVGDSLTVNAGQWNQQPSAVAFQWQSCAGNGTGCLPIPNATTETYEPQTDDVGQRLQAQVTATTPAGSATVQTAYTPMVLPPAAGDASSGGGNEGACRAPALAVHFGKSATATVRFGHNATLHGHLSCSGQPIGNAVVGITDGSQFRRIRTAAKGEFAYTPLAGHSRTLHVTYPALVDGHGPGAHATAHLNVTPLITLMITPRSLGNGRRITLTGEVRGGPYPVQGVVLNLQYRSEGHWHTFDQAIARHHRGTTATYIFIYRFQHTVRPTLFSFRAVLPTTGSAGYPYSPPGASNDATVQVT